MEVLARCSEHGLFSKWWTHRAHPGERLCPVCQALCDEPVEYVRADEHRMAVAALDALWGSLSPMERHHTPQDVIDKISAVS